MLRIKGYRADYFLAGNLNSFADRFYTYNVIWLDLGLFTCNFLFLCFIIFHYGLNIDYLNRICLGTLFFNRRSAESHCNELITAPNSFIQQTVSKPKIDIICHYRNYFGCVLAGSLCFFLNSFFNRLANSCSSRSHACRKHALVRMDVNNRTIFHCKCCVEFGMFARFRHRHHNLLLLIHLRNSIPGSLRPIIIVRHRIRFQRFAVNDHRLDGVANLVLDAED